MLTCKSLFGLGYRGERLIEPLRWLLRWSRVWPVRADASRSGSSGSGRRRDRQIAGTRRYAVGRAGRRKRRPAPGSAARGYPNNPTDRRNPQPSPKCRSRHTDAVHRLDVGRGRSILVGRPLRYSRTPPRGGRTEEVPDRGRRAVWDGGRLPGQTPASSVGVIASSWFPPKCPPGQLELVSVLSGKAND